MKKRKIALLLAAALVLNAFLFAACGGNGTPGTTDPAGTTTAAPTDGTTAEPVVLKLATWVTPDNPLQAPLDTFMEEVETTTNGGVTFEFYGSDILGTYETVFEEVMSGSIDMNVNVISSKYDQRMEILYFFYIVSNYDELVPMFAPGTYLHDLHVNVCEPKGVKFLGFFAHGFTGLGVAVDRPVTNWEVPGAPKDVIVRSAAMRALSESLKMLGYNQVVTISYADLYSALQTGVAEAWIGCSSNLVYYSFRDVAKQYIDIKNMFETGAIMINAEQFNNMPTEWQEAIQTAADNAWNTTVAQAESDDLECWQLLRDYGCNVILPTDEQLQDVATFTRDEIWPALSDLVGGDEVLQEFKDSYGF